jgi:radical SAM superfamily enzyme YgiQ (UPF0313 family)
MFGSVVLVDFYWTRDKDPRVPLGHASLLAALREEGIEARSIVIAVNEGQHDPQRVAAAVFDAAANGSDVAFGAYVWGEDLLRAVLRELRRMGFGGRIVLGGPQISYSSGGLEALYPEADAFLRGYGERALPELVRSATGQAIVGVHWAGHVDLNKQAQVDLESIPSPWLSGTIPLEGQAFIRWETQRGCPYRCGFCQHREAGARLFRRALAQSRIDDEIDLFCASGVSDIAVLDPVFNAGPNAVAILERFAAHGYRGRLSLQCRAELVNDAFLDAAAALNVVLEFGLQTIHTIEGKAVSRQNQIDKVDKALAGVRARNITHEVSLIFGLPCQTLASFRASVAWCLERRVPVIKAFPLVLLRGTATERDRAMWGLRDSGGSMPLVIASDTFDEAAWAEMARLSEALKHTEGRHPATLGELDAVARALEPDVLRWIPETTRLAA